MTLIGLIEVWVSMMGSVVSMAVSISTGSCLVCSIVSSRLVMSLSSRSVVGVGVRSIVLGSIFCVVIMGSKVFVVTDLGVGMFCTIVASTGLASISSSIVSTVRSILVSMRSRCIVG